MATSKPIDQPVQKDLPKVPPPSLPKKPAPVSGPTAANASAPTPGTSLASQGSDVARRWITPVLEHRYVKEEQGATAPGFQPSLAKTEVSQQSYIWLVNPDTAKSLRVRIICHKENGAVSGQAKEHTLAPMGFVQIMPTWGSGSGPQQVWCRIDAPRPVVAYGESYHYRRGGSSIEEHHGSITEQKMVPFFKADP